MKPQRPEQQSLFERTPDEVDAGKQAIAEIKDGLAQKIYHDRRDEGRRT